MTKVVVSSIGQQQTERLRDFVKTVLILDKVWDPWDYWSIEWGY